MIAGLTPEEREDLSRLFGKMARNIAPQAGESKEDAEND